MDLTMYQFCTSKSSTVSLGESYFQIGSLPIDLSKWTRNFMKDQLLQFLIFINFVQVYAFLLKDGENKVAYSQQSVLVYKVGHQTFNLLGRVQFPDTEFLLLLSESHLNSIYNDIKAYQLFIKITIIIGNMTREACIKCRSIPNDILVLECDHSLCMKCASRFCSIESSTIMCPFCKSQTYLEQSIVNQICQYSVGAQEEQIRRAGFFDQRKPLEAKQVWYKMSNKENMVAENTDYPSFNKADSRFKMSRKNSLERHPEIKKAKKQAKDQIKYHQQEKGSLRPSTVYCKYHSEYEVMYLCLECQSSIICPECVIHGEHKNHQVETIKKTITKIQAELSSKIYTLGCSIEGLVGASEQKKQKLKSKIEQINKLKIQAASKYKMIRQEIAREEAEVMSKCTNLIACFQEDFSQIQKWIKNDLLAIQRQRDSINYILNPYSQKNGKKQGKVDQKLIQVKIVEQYLNHFRKNDKYKSNKYLWLNNKQISEQSQPESEQNLTVLTDRIQRIKFVPTASTSTKIDYNEMATKNHSLAASRNVNGLKQSKSGFTNDKKQSYYRYVESPFNNLKMSTDKENNGFETESILIKASHIKDSSKMKRKSLKSEEQTNFLIF